MKDVLWYIEDILRKYPKGTVITTDLLITIIQKANEQRAKDEEEINNIEDFQSFLS